MDGGNTMYTERELKRAAQIIKHIARENNVPEAQVRADMQEAMDYGRNNPDPSVQARWKGFRFAGSEPTLEECILWVAAIANNPSLKIDSDVI